MSVHIIRRVTAVAAAISSLIKRLLVKSGQVSGMRVKGIKFALVLEVGLKYYVKVDVVGKNDGADAHLRPQPVNLCLELVVLLAD